MVSNVEFSYLTSKHNPGSSSALRAYQHAERSLYLALCASSEEFRVTFKSSAAVDWSSVKIDNKQLIVPGIESRVPGVASELKLRDLSRVESLRAFEFDVDPTRAQQFDAKWAEHIRGDDSLIVLRDWPDDLLTELLWEVAHQTPKSDPKLHVRLQFDDESECDFPVGILQTEVSVARVSAQRLLLSMISNRHPEMDAMTHGSLFLNRETQIDGNLALLADASRDRAKEFFVQAPRDLQVEIFQTGLAAVVVGLWLGVTDVLHGQGTTDGRVTVLPRFFRTTASGDGGYLEDGYARGRPW